MGYLGYLVFIPLKSMTYVTYNDLVVVGVAGYACYVVQTAHESQIITNPQAMGKRSQDACRW